ncbi:hypothetical protein ACH6CV_11740 [Bacillota bacterium Meth-B3]
MRTWIGMLLLCLAPACLLTGCQAPPEDPFLKETQTVARANPGDPVPLKTIHEGTLRQFVHAFAEPNYGWHIAAQVDVPSDLERFDVIAVGIGDELDFDALMASDVLPKALAAAETYEDESLNFVSPAPIPVKARMHLSDGVVRYSVNSSIGQLNYSETAPDDYFVEGPDFTSRPVAHSGNAQNCALTPAQATNRIRAFLDGLPLPFAYDIGQVIALSREDPPGPGHYQIQIRQIVDRKPVAVFDNSSSIGWGLKVDPGYIPSQLGSYATVYDYGIENLRLRWLSNAFEVIQGVDGLLSLPNAVSAVEQFLKRLGDEGASGNYARAAFPRADEGIEIHAIRLEYAPTRREGERLILEPCWSFEGWGITQSFYGIRVNALTGEIVSAAGRG